MALTESGKICDRIMGKLLREYPDIKWSVNVNWLLGYHGTISYIDGPTPDEISECLNEMVLGHKVIVTFERTFSSEKMLKEAKKIADASWILVDLNDDNIYDLEIHGATLGTLAKYALKPQSFTKRATKT